VSVYLALLSFPLVQCFLLLLGNLISYKSTYSNITPSNFPYNTKIFVCLSVISQGMTDRINTNVLEVGYEARAPHSEERISKITDDRRCGESEITVPMSMFRCDYTLLLTGFVNNIFTWYGICLN